MSTKRHPFRHICIGLLTNKKYFIFAEHLLTVEARDDNGSGNSATTRLQLIIKDVNDEKPKFKKDEYTGVLETNSERLREPVIVEAVDADATQPNNQVKT